VVPTIGFKLLYGFVIVRIDRRDLVWINVTTNPTAEWIARQITEAFPWDGAPGYMIRDRDRIYGAVVTRRLRAMGIRDKPIAPASPSEWLCRAADRIDPARVFGPHHCLGRGASAPGSYFLCRLLQLRQNASVVAQGCADVSSDSTDRNHSFTPDPRRTSPSLRPGLSFRYTHPAILYPSRSLLANHPLTTETLTNGDNQDSKRLNTAGLPYVSRRGAAFGKQGRGFCRGNVIWAPR
jgi:hypothetical protein